MSKTLDEIQQEVGAWGDATFPQSNWQSVRSHLTEEVLEMWGVEEKHIAGVLALVRSLSNDRFRGPSQEEAADAFILLLHYAHKERFSLFTEAESKMAENRQRTWKTTPEPGGHFKHEAAS